MPYEGVCGSADEASDCAHLARAKMDECVALLKTEADDRRRQRLFVDYVTLFGLWLEYKREHLRSLDATSGYRDGDGPRQDEYGGQALRSIARKGIEWFVIDGEPS